MSALAPSPTIMTPEDSERIDSFSFPAAASSSSSSLSTTTSTATATTTQPSSPRRTPAYYPNVNSTNKLQKPFSRSAAKRESVMALGSIEHLQHYFTKAGIAAKKDAMKQNKGLVPAIGGAAGIHVPQKPSLGSIQEFHLPPSPAIPTFTHRTHSNDVENKIKTYEVDPEALKPGVISDLDNVAEAWSLPPSSKSHYALKAEAKAEEAKEEEEEGESVDILATLKCTTTLVRSVRNYMLSLPDPTSIPSSDSKPRFRPSSLQPMPIKRNVSSNSGSGGPGSTTTTTAAAAAAAAATTDPLARIRRSALDVLTALRTLEETARVPLDDDAYDAQSDRLSSQDSRSPEMQHMTPPGPDPEPIDLRSPPRSRGASPTPKVGYLPGVGGRASSLGHDVSFAVSLVTLPGRKEGVPVWDEPEDDFNASDGEGAGEKHEVWDERLVLGGGWLYRQDIKLKDLKGPREVVGRYLDACDEVLFGENTYTGNATNATTEGTRTRAWVTERARLEKEKARAGSRRTSLGRERSPARDRDRDREGRRIVSADMLGAMRSMVITEEELVEEPEEEEEIERSEDASVSSIDSEDLPLWARRNAFVDDPLARAHALLSALLPSSLLPLLPSPYTTNSNSNSRQTLLTSLSSGQLLCAAYNVGVRRSRKPWGYINADAIHDIATLESRDHINNNNNNSKEASGQAEKEKEKRQTGWTFRRTDNLRLWAAALKLRYLVPLTAPSPLSTTIARPRISLPLSPSPSLSSSSSPGPAPPLSATSASSSGYERDHDYYAEQPLTPADGPGSGGHGAQVPSVKVVPNTGIGSGTNTGSSMGMGMDSASGVHVHGGNGEDEGRKGGKGGKGRETIPLIEFDAKRVARREDGWESMLETVLFCWVHAVVDERRAV